MKSRDGKTDPCILHGDCGENAEIDIITCSQHAMHHIVSYFGKVYAYKENGCIIFNHYRKLIFFKHQVGELYPFLQFLLHQVYLIRKMNFSSGNASAQLLRLKRAGS